MDIQDEEVVVALLDREFKKYLSNPENIESASNSLIDDLVDDAIIDVVFEIDIKRKCPIFQNGSDDEYEEFQLSETFDEDIFGYSINEKLPECICPVCNASMASIKFAPHVANCMGEGRTSSRIARSRIASYANKDTKGRSTSNGSDDEDDADWTTVTEKKNKKKKEKSSVKKVKTNRTSKSSSDGSSTSNICFENMTERDRRALLSQICGVISEHTKKVCTKSTKCPQHSDDQKKALRDFYLSESIESYIDNIQIDVDTLEEEGEIVKESLTRSWEAENSNTSSPTDSASTSSSSSKKKEKALKLKNKEF